MPGAEPGPKAGSCCGPVVWRGCTLLDARGVGCTAGWGAILLSARRTSLHPRQGGTACTYRVEVQTSDVRRAGTAGSVFLTVIGEAGAIGGCWGQGGQGAGWSSRMPGDASWCCSRCRLSAPRVACPVRCRSEPGSGRPDSACRAVPAEQHRGGALPAGAPGAGAGLVCRAACGAAAGATHDKAAAGPLQCPPAELPVLFRCRASWTCLRFTAQPTAGASDRSRCAGRAGLRLWLPLRCVTHVT